LQSPNPISLSLFHPQSNLPYFDKLTSDELKFSKVFIKSLKLEIDEKKLINYILGSELNLNGYGIADLALLEQWPIKNTKKKSKRNILTVFEVKIKDWRKALKQAYRYKYYSHKSIIVMPDYNVDRAIKNLSTFKILQIGLWVFSESSNSLRKIYTPKVQKPFSKLALTKAKAILTQKN
jgi:hypothetical protein